MKTSFLLPLATFAALALAASAADSPKDAVKAAAKKLGEKDNYSFVSTPKVDGAGGGQRFQAGPTEGKVNKDGFATLATKVGENTTEIVFKGAKGVLKTADGWKTAEELAAAAQGGDNAAKGRSFMAGRMLRTFKAPAAQAAELADKAKELKEADGVISGDLTEEGAKELMSFGGRPGGQAPQISGAKGSVKFWVKDGAVAKYELHTEGTMTFNNNDITLNRTTTVEIKDVGTTKLTVPDEAKAKL